MDLTRRAAVHAALGDPTRLRIVHAVVEGDRSPTELARETGVRANLLAHHLDVLESVGVVERLASAGDGRRRYVTVGSTDLATFGVRPSPLTGPVAFVCTHNSARSQFAAAWWRSRAGRSATSAGSSPAPSVHPLAVEAAAGFGIDLSTETPQGYEAVDGSPTVISVCDRALEGGLPDHDRHLHWSTPDPTDDGGLDAFVDSFERLERRLLRARGDG